MSKKDKGSLLKEIKQKYEAEAMAAAEVRQAVIAEELSRIHEELNEMISFPIQLDKEVRAKIGELAKLVDHRPAQKTTEDEGVSVSTEAKKAFVLMQLTEGPLSKKTLLDRAEDEFSRSVARTFLDQAILESEEQKEIKRQGREGRSPVFVLAKSKRK